MTAILIADAPYDRAAVDRFVEPLRPSADSTGAAYFAAALLGGTLLPVRVLELRARFNDLPPWVRAGVIDEVRDMLDKKLEEVFRKAVEVAQKEVPHASIR
jgi:hypothetical protein